MSAIEVLTNAVATEIISPTATVVEIAVATVTIELLTDAQVTLGGLVSGTKVYYVIGIPASNTGSDGDIAVSSSALLYKKIAGIWVLDPTITVIIGDFGLNFSNNFNSQYIGQVI